MPYSLSCTIIKVNKKNTSVTNLLYSQIFILKYIFFIVVIIIDILLGTNFTLTYSFAYKHINSNLEIPT